MQKKKVIGPDEAPIKEWKIIGNISIGWLKDLFIVLLQGEKPE